MNTANLIQQIVAIEWIQFSAVQNVDGPADCQSNMPAFCAMRTIQASIWQASTLVSYLNDLQVAEGNEHNLMTEKYARMMATTHPEEYQSIKDHLPPITAEKQQVLEKIMAIFTRWEREAKHLAINSVVMNFQPETALVYLYGELATYSIATLTLCLQDIEEASRLQRNFVQEILEKTLAYYQATNASTAAQQSNQPYKTSSCGTCGIDIPVGESTDLNEVAHELLNYELPSFYEK